MNVTTKNSVNHVLIPRNVSAWWFMIDRWSRFKTFRIVFWHFHGKPYKPSSFNFRGFRSLTASSVRTPHLPHQKFIFSIFKLGGKFWKVYDCNKLRCYRLFKTGQKASVRQFQRLIVSTSIHFTSKRLINRIQPQWTISDRDVPF